MLQKKDQHMRKHNMARLNPRHSRFVGTYVAMNMKSISNAHNQICHKPARDMVDILDDGNKKISKKPRHRLATEVFQILSYFIWVSKALFTNFRKARPTGSLYRTFEFF